MRIGAHCHIGPYTMMLDNDFHRIEPERRLERPPSKPIVIEENVWIGARVILDVRRDGRARQRASGPAASSRPTSRRARSVAGVPARVIKEL